MKKLAFLVALVATFACGSKETPTPTPEPDPDPTPVTSSFIQGADISWASEMEAGWLKESAASALIPTR